MEQRQPLRVVASTHRARCLITDLRPERGLTRTLTDHLEAVLPGIEFTLDPSLPVDAIWACGYEPNGLDGVRRLREEHPEAVLVVTGGAVAPGWEAPVLDAGADHARRWPMSVPVLASLLFGGRDRGISAAV